MKILNQDNQRSSLQPEREQNILDAKHLFSEARLAKRKPTEFLLIERREMKKIKNLLDKIKPVSQVWQNAFWASVSLLAAAVFFLVAISPTEQREWIKIFGWTAIIVSSVFSITFLTLCLRERNNLIASVENIKEEVAFFEEKYILDENSE